MRYKKFIFDNECIFDNKNDTLIFPFQEEYIEYQDWIINNPNDLNFHGKVRKLSCIVFLSNPSDYTGGQLKFDFRNNAVGCNIQEIKQNGKGNMIVFPSFLWHKVFPVLSGERYSLVSWYVGKPFK